MAHKLGTKDNLRGSLLPHVGPKDGTQSLGSVAGNTTPSCLASLAFGHNRQASSDAPSSGPRLRKQTLKPRAQINSSSDKLFLQGILLQRKVVNTLSFFILSKSQPSRPSALAFAPKATKMLGVWAYHRGTLQTFSTTPRHQGSPSSTDTKMPSRKHSLAGLFLVSSVTVILQHLFEPVSDSWLCSLFLSSCKESEAVSNLCPSESSIRSTSPAPRERLSRFILKSYLCKSPSWDGRSRSSDVGHD